MVNMIHSFIVIVTCWMLADWSSSGVLFWEEWCRLLFLSILQGILDSRMLLSCSTESESCIIKLHRKHLDVLLHVFCSSIPCPELRKWFLMWIFSYLTSEWALLICIRLSTWSENVLFFSGDTDLADLFV